MYRTRLATVAMVLMLLSLASVSAQMVDEVTVFCGDLAEADCQILKDNAAVMDAVKAFALDMSMTMNVAGGYETGNEGAMSLTLEAEGSLAVSSEALAGISGMDDELMGMDGSMLTEEQAALLDAFLAGLTGDLSAELQVAGADEITDMSLHLMIKEGVLLLDAATLQEATGQPMQGMNWFGINVNGLFELLRSDPTFAADSQQAADSMKMEDAVAAGSAATTVTRLPDSEVNGVAVVVFETTVDITQFLSLHNMQDLMQLADSAEAMIGEQMGAMGFTMREYIGLTDSYTYRTELTFDMAQADGDMGEGGSDAMLFDMSMSIDMDNFNHPVVVEIPEDAFVMPLSMLTQMSN